MLVRVLYASRAEGPQTGTVTASILAAAQRHNRKNGITGILCHGQGLYLQVIEGDRSAINQLYARLLQDRRHKDVEILSFEEIAERRFPNWSMAHVSLSDADPMIRMKHPEFDPYSASGAFVMKRVDELVSSGHPITLPPV